MDLFVSILQAVMMIINILCAYNAKYKKDIHGQVYHMSWTIIWTLFLLN